MPPTPPATPTSTPSHTASPSPTPSASTSAPPFSCATRAEGCAAATLALAPPLVPSGAALSNATPAALLASFPVLRTPFSVRLPLPPSPGEAITVTCELTGGAPGAVLLAAPAAQPLPACAAGAAAVCQAVPSSPSAAAGEVAVGFVLAGAPPASDPSGGAPPLLPLRGAAVACTVASTPVGADRAHLPRYGAATRLTAPLAALPPALPVLLAAALAESAARPGSFFGLGSGAQALTAREWGNASAEAAAGGAQCAPPPPPPLLPPVPAANASASGNHTSAPLPWSTPGLPALCPGAVAALAAAAAAAAAEAAAAAAEAASPPVFTAFLSGATHVLLLAPPAHPFPPSLRVFLGGLPCAVNWLAANGSVASVTTPTLAALCAAAGASAAEFGGDCGIAPLTLLDASLGSFAQAAIAAAADAAAAALLPPLLPPPQQQQLLYPASYPPLLPASSLAPALAAAARDAAAYLARAGTLPPAASALGANALLAPTLASTLAELDAAARALAPPTAGLRVLVRCTDPTYAPPEACAVAGAGAGEGRLALRYANASAALGSACAWGAGEACVACPPGALCPGGAVLLPLPGFWAPALASAPSALVACSEPEALARCPGGSGSAGGGGVCGAPYRGVACGACALGYYPLAGACAACPTLTSSLQVALPFLLFVLGLGGFGVGLGLGLYAALRAHAALAGDGSVPTPWEIAAAVQELLLWLFTSFQVLCALFGQAAGAAPAFLAPFYVSVTALQFQGITVDPACYSSIPFQAAWVALGVVCGCIAVGSTALAAHAAGAAAAAALPARAPAPQQLLLLLQGAAAASKGAAPPPPCCRRATSPLAGATSASPAARPTVLQRLLRLLPTAEATLRLCCLVFILGFGALAKTFIGVLACTAPQPVTVLSYLNSVSDGSALAQLGAGAPSYADLLRASRDPVFSRARGLGATLARSLLVPLLQADAFVVCGEDAHAAAARGAGAGLALLLLFPCVTVLLMGQCSQAQPLGAGACGGRRRIAGREGSGSDSGGSAASGRTDGSAGAAAVVNVLAVAAHGRAAEAARPASAALPLQGPVTFSAAALRALSVAVVIDPAFRPGFVHVPALEQLYVLLTFGFISAAQSRADAASFALPMGLAAALSPLLGLLFLVYQPMQAEHAWKNPVKCALYTTAGVTALLTIVNRVGGHSAGVRVAVGALPLAIALLLALVLLYCWQRNLLRAMRLVAQERAAAAAAAAVAAAAAAAVAAAAARVKAASAAAAAAAATLEAADTNALFSAAAAAAAAASAAAPAAAPAATPAAQDPPSAPAPEQAANPGAPTVARRWLWTLLVQEGSDQPTWQRQGSAQLLTTPPPEEDRDASGWERCLDVASGDVWWHNGSGESSWEEPPLPHEQPLAPAAALLGEDASAPGAPAAAAAAGSAGAPVGDCWVRVVSATGEVTFHNTATGEVTWRPPAAMLSAAGARKLGARESALKTASALGSAMALFRRRGEAMTELQAALTVQRAVRRRQLKRQAALWARVARYEGTQASK